MKSEKSSFNTELAFSRNLGWLSADEQLKISKIHVGIVGLGGVGGQYAEILTRLGVQQFTIYDSDEFSVENTNRQNECRVSNYGRNKADVIAAMIMDINPQAQVHSFSKFLSSNEVNSFCDSIDIYLDALDFFVIDLRIAIFRRMREIGKTAMTAAPIGTGSALLIFGLGSMTFDDYFGFHKSSDPVERSNMFLIGLAPSLQHVRCIKERNRADFVNQKLPSLPMGVYSCAAVIATTLMKVVLNRGPVRLAPWSIHWDPYIMKVKRKYIWWGHRNPLQLIKLFILKKVTARIQGAKCGAPCRRIFEPRFWHVLHS